MTFPSDVLPKKIVPLSGALCRQWVRCGRPRCRCREGELHGPYWYHFDRDSEGRLWKKYVKKQDLPDVQARIAAYRRLQFLLAHYNRIGWVHSTREDRREIQGYINALHGVE